MQTSAFIAGAAASLVFLGPLAPVAVLGGAGVFAMYVHIYLLFLCSLFHLYYCGVVCAVVLSRVVYCCVVLCTVVSCRVVVCTVVLCCVVLCCVVLCCVVLCNLFKWSGVE